jgi:cytoskeleton protein RodZ
MSPVPGQNMPELESSPPEAAVEADSAPARPKHTIGALLRETRESYGGDTERIANALRIRAQYLVAIEEGRYDRLPAPVYALGFVRAYAIHLGLDGEEAVRRFKQEASGFEISRDLVFPVPLSDRGIPHGRILAAAVLLLLAAYGAWYYLSSGGRLRPERVSAVPKALLQPSPTPPAAAPVLPAASPAVAPPPPPQPATTRVPAAALPPPSTVAAPQTATLPTSPPAPIVKPPTETNPQVAPVLRPPPGVAPLPPPHAEASPPTQTAAASPVGGASGPAQIVLRAQVDCWVKVRDQDGTIVFEHLLKAGDAYRVPDEQGLQLEAGNASGLAVTVDGQAVPPLTGRVRHDIRLDPALLKAGAAIVD